MPLDVGIGNTFVLVDPLPPIVWLHSAARRLTRLERDCEIRPGIADEDQREIKAARAPNQHLISRGHFEMANRLCSPSSVKRGSLAPEDLMPKLLSVNVDLPREIGWQEHRRVHAAIGTDLAEHTSSNAQAITDICSKNGFFSSHHSAERVLITFLTIRRY